MAELDVTQMRLDIDALSTSVNTLSTNKEDKASLKALAYKASLAATDIPNLSASKITSGSFSADRIPSLNASKITSGTLPVSRGGTGATTAEDARTNLGITGSIVTCGTDLSNDNCRWWKWDNGLAIVWFEVYQNMTYQAFGNQFRTSTSKVFTFPFELLGYHFASGSGGGEVWYSGNWKSRTQAEVHAYSAGSGTKLTTFNVGFIGRWK